LARAERDELARLRRENRQLKTERDILAKATAWMAGNGQIESSSLVLAAQYLLLTRPIAWA
jgi:transposase